LSALNASLPWLGIVKPMICNAPPSGSLSLARTASSVVAPALRVKLSATALGGLLAASDRRLSPHTRIDHSPETDDGGTSIMGRRSLRSGSRHAIRA
jgi:hypothetical protein